MDKFYNYLDKCLGIRLFYVCVNVCMYVLAISGCAQGLLLALSSGIITGQTLGSIFDGGD